MTTDTSNSGGRSISSIGSRRSGRNRYRGRMQSVKAMNQLPPIKENYDPLPPNYSRRALKLSIAAVLAYIAFGTLVYSLWVPEWTVVDAMYFSMATLTTVGLGGYQFGEGQRGFTMFFIILGTTVLSAILFGYLFDHLYNIFEGIYKESKARTSNYFLDRLDNGGPEGLEMDNDNETFLSDFLKCCLKSIPWLIALVVLPLIMGYYEGWSILGCIYFTINVTSTVGFAEIAPQNIWMKFLAVFYLPICLVVGAKLVSKFMAVYIKHKANTNEQQFFSRKLTLTDFDLMDIEDAGQVGYDEFLVFLLVAMGKVSPEDIQQMEELYQRLDAENDGCINIEDLFTMAYGDPKNI